MQKAAADERYHLSLERAEAEYQRRQLEDERHKLEADRIRILNDYLVELFIRTRRTPPTEIILDRADASARTFTTELTVRSKLSEAKFQQRPGRVH